MEIEQSHMLNWKMRQYSLLPAQEKFVATMVEFLVKTRTHLFQFYPMPYTEKKKSTSCSSKPRKNIFYYPKGKFVFK